MQIIEAYDLPSREQITALNFVVRLESDRTEEASRKLVEEYVLTPAVNQELPKIFRYLRDIWARGEEMGWFVHGSFGSGKSHFLSFVGMLLEDMEVAWTKPVTTVQQLAHENRDWVRQARPLVVRVHMLSARGNRDFDRALYEGFNEAMQRYGKRGFEFLHVVGVLDEMRKEGEQYGDVFWHLLRQAGILGSREDFEEQAAGSHEDRESLARSYLEFKQRDAASAGLNPNWAEGLQRMMRHAQNEGFGGVVFLVDELLLWLSEKRADEFKRAINQLNTRVDHADGRRALPMCVFVARQRNIKEFFPELAHEDELHQHLDHHAKRFNVTTLQDVELRHICKERVLRPRQAAAVAQAVEEATSKHRKLLPTLLQSADESYLRDVYPFHPALIEMLIDVSALMQRERTALKLLYELLVVHYPQLPLGKFLPVGSAFEAIFPESGIEGSQRQNDLKAIHQLYYGRFKLAMADLATRTATAPEESDRFTETSRKLLDQLIKTVLLAEVSPRLKGTKGVSIERLVQLNDVDVPGTLDRARVELARKWLVQLSSLVPALQIVGTDKNAAVSVVLQGVNFGEILERARGKVQNPHTRLRTFCRVLAGSLNANEEKLVKEREIELGKIDWRKTTRKGSIALLNVREQTALAFKPRDGEEWRVLLDYPWDTDNHTVEDDVRRAQEIRKKEGTFYTYCWLPHHLTPAEERDLIELAAAEYIASPEGQSELLGNLNPHERQQATEQAANYVSTWKAKVKEVVQKVYGDQAQIVSMRDRADQSLLDRNDLAESLRKLIRDILDKRYPNHPAFGMAPSVMDLGLLAKWVTEAFQTPDNRVGFDDATQKMLVNLGKPLELVDIGQTKGRLILDGRYLKMVLAEVSSGSASWSTIDQKLEDQFGLQPSVRTFFLVLLCQCYGFRALKDGQPIDVRIDHKPYAGIQLKLGRLLEAAPWSLLRTAAQAAFGVEVPSRRSLHDQDVVAKALSREARQRHTTVTGLHTSLYELTRDPQLPRLALLKETTAKLARLLVHEDAESHDVLSTFLEDWGQATQPWQELAQRAPAFAVALTRLDRSPLELLRDSHGERPEAAEHIRTLHTLLGRADGAIPREEELTRWSRDAMALLKRLVPVGPEPRPEPLPPPPPPPPAPGWADLLPGVEVNAKDGDALVEFWGKLKKELMNQPAGDIEIRVQIKPRSSKGA